MCPGRSSLPGIDGLLEDFDFEKVFGDPEDPIKVDSLTKQPMPGGRIPKVPQQMLPAPKPGARKVPARDALRKGQSDRPFAGRRRLRDFNPYHEPGGSEIGGRFASGPGGGSGKGTPGKKPPAEGPKPRKATAEEIERIKQVAAEQLTKDGIDPSLFSIKDHGEQFNLMGGEPSAAGHQLR